MLQKQVFLKSHDRIKKNIKKKKSINYFFFPFLTNALNRWAIVANKVYALQ